jgi:hypothetical protein
MTRQCAILVAIALAACPKPTPAPAPPTPPADAALAQPVDTPPPVPLDEDLPRLALRGVELFEEVDRVFVASGKDCAAATAKLRALQPTYADVAKANAKVLHEGAAKALRGALEQYATRLDAAAKSIATSTTMAECSDDREFTDAFDNLVGVP